MGVEKVTAAKPAVGGALSIASPSTSLVLPTSATATLATDFKKLGYISEDGLTNESSPETEEIKAWGGDVVLTPMTGKTDKFTFKLIESLDAEVLKYIFGAANVTVDTSTSDITVAVKANEPNETVMVFDMIVRGGKKKRIVIPSGWITEIGEIAYADSDVTGYEVTVNAAPNASGVTHYEYIEA